MYIRIFTICILLNFHQAIFYSSLEDSFCSRNSSNHNQILQDYCGNSNINHNNNGNSSCYATVLNRNIDNDKANGNSYFWKAGDSGCLVIKIRTHNSNKNLTKELSVSLLSRNSIVPTIRQKCHLHCDLCFFKFRAPEVLFLFLLFSYYI